MYVKDKIMIKNFEVSGTEYDMGYAVGKRI